MSSIADRLRSRTARSNSSTAANATPRPSSILRAATVRPAPRATSSSRVVWSSVRVRQIALDLWGRDPENPPKCARCNSNYGTCACNRWDSDMIGGLEVTLDEPVITAAEPIDAMPFLHRVGGGAANRHAELEINGQRNRRDRRRSGIFVHVPNPDVRFEAVPLDENAVADDLALVELDVMQPAEGLVELGEEPDANEAAGGDADVEPDAMYAVEDPVELGEEPDANEADDDEADVELDVMYSVEDPVELGEEPGANEAAGKVAIEVAIDDAVQASGDTVVADPPVKAIAAGLRRVRNRRDGVVRELSSTLNGSYWLWPARRHIPMRA